MSHVALRRVMVRMLHDPGLVAAVYADPDGALAERDLTPAERGWLVATPRAAWAADPDRPARVLAALCDEFPAATRLAPGRTRSFFASAAFHRAVQEGGSLALALGAHLAGDGDPAVAQVAGLEAAVAAVRRAPRRPPPSPPGALRLAPAAALAVVAAGTLALLERLRCGGAPERLDANAREHVLAVRTPGGDVTLEEVSPDLAGLLAAAREPVGRAVLCDRVRDHDPDPAAADAVVAALVADGLLV